jgi:hypothetical protein
MTAESNDLMMFTVYQIEWQHAARGELQLLLQPFPGDLHDGLEVDHVSFIVFEQCGKGVGTATEMLVPEHNRLVAAHLLNLRVAKDSQKRLDSFEATAVAQPPRHMKQIDVGLTEPKVGKKAGDERQVKSTAIKGNQQIITLYGIFELFQVLPVDEVVRLEAVIEADDGNFVVVTAHARGLDVQKAAAVSEVPIEPPALGRGEAVVEVTGLAAVLNGLVELAGYASPAFGIFGPILKMKLQVIPGENSPAPEIDLGPGTDVGEV